MNGTRKPSPRQGETPKPPLLRHPPPKSFHAAWGRTNTPTSALCLRPRLSTTTALRGVRCWGLLFQRSGLRGCLRPDASPARAKPAWPQQLASAPAPAELPLIRLYSRRGIFGLWPGCIGCWPTRRIALRHKAVRLLGFQLRRAPIPGWETRPKQRGLHLVHGCPCSVGKLLLLCTHRIFGPRRDRASFSFDASARAPTNWRGARYCCVGTRYVSHSFLFP